MIAKERLYLTADQKSVVKEGDPKAAFLLVGVGGEISDKLAASLGLSDSSPSTIEGVANDTEPETAPENRTVSTKSIKRR